MIEHVARAIAGTLGDSNWKRYLPSARAALLAIREPTDDMLDAALPGNPDWGFLPEEWRAIVDFLLSGDEHHVTKERFIVPRVANSRS